MPTLISSSTLSETLCSIPKKAQCEGIRFFILAPARTFGQLPKLPADCTRVTAARCSASPRNNRDITSDSKSYQVLMLKPVSLANN